MSVLPQLRPTEVVDGVYQLSSLGAKVTAIVSGGDVLLVDTGARGSYPLVARSLERLGLSEDRIRGIVLTHSHPDHAGALGTFVERTDAWVTVHEDDCGVLDSHLAEEMLPVGWTQRVARVFEPVLYDGRVTDTMHVPSGDSLDWPDDVVVIHTPGHTPGSISLYMPERKTIVVGDALQYRFRRLAGPSKVVTADYPQAIESLHVLAGLDFETIAFSHFRPLRRNGKQRLEALLERAAA